MKRVDRLHEVVRKPLPLPYHPLYRFYQGGALVRAFRGLPPGQDDWYSEDWVGSCTMAGNPDPEGRPQGLSAVEVPGLGPVTLKELIEAFPEEMVGARFVERWGPTTAVLVKILSPAGPVPLHGHPDRPWAARHLKSRFGKIEGWIILDAVGDGREPAYFAAGFRAGASREWFRKAIERRDHEGMRAQLYRTEVKPGELYVAYPGVPHCMGPQILSIELQEPTDHMVIAECAPEKDQEATMGLGWDRALEVFDCSPTTAEAAFSRARQRPTVLSESRGNRETRLVNADVLDYWDAIRLEVAGEVDVVDGRFCIGIVTAGEGSLEGDFGSLPLRRGDAFACAAALGHRLRVGRERLQVVRCLGPLV